MDQRPDSSTAMWSSPADDQILFDAECSPTKTCRNMVDVGFEGFADTGTDLRTAWRTTLEREGKVSNAAPSLRELVLGSADE